MMSLQHKTTLRLEPGQRVIDVSPGSFGFGTFLGYDFDIPGVGHSASCWVDFDLHGERFGPASVLLPVGALHASA